MGGTVSVQSEEGVGTTFSINLLTKSKIKNPIYLEI
jgi:signal transduction histidine kinase